MKTQNKNQIDQHVLLLQTHLVEFVWRWYVDNRPFENIVLGITDTNPM